MNRIALVALVLAVAAISPAALAATDDGTVQANVQDFLYLAVSSAARNYGNVTPDTCASGTDVGDVTVTNPPGDLTIADLTPFGNIWEKDDPLTVLVISSRAYNVQVHGTKAGSSNLPIGQLKIVDDDDPATPQALTTSAADLVDTGDLNEQAGFKWDRFDFRLTVAPLLDDGTGGATALDDSIDLSKETNILSTGTFTVTVTFTAAQLP